MVGVLAYWTGQEHRQSLTQPELFRVENPGNHEGNVHPQSKPRHLQWLHLFNPQSCAGTRGLSAFRGDLEPFGSCPQPCRGGTWLQPAQLSHTCWTRLLCLHTKVRVQHIPHTPKQGMWHKYLLSQQMVPPEGKNHQGLMAPMQCTHCRWVTNPIVTLILRNKKCWAITNSHHSAPSGMYKTGPFGSNEILISEKLNPHPQKSGNGISGYDGCACPFLCVSPSWTLHSTVNSLQSSH